ncbi:MAG: NAD(P)H-dependent oxidoreductase subunit E [Fibrobacterota bacterium]|nr:NAD(P)H-dependent oxidoreductase subunit E [Fibrobacterota bacterium]
MSPTQKTPDAGVPASGQAAAPAAVPDSGTKRRTEFSPERMAIFHEYAEEYPNKRSALMMVLRLAEEEFGSVTDEAMEITAGLCNVSVAHVQGMVTFYTHFKRPFHGKHRFMVCATLMCALENNTDAALIQIKAKLGIGAGEKTADGLFSCEKVECLADCDKPPVVQCDNEHFCSMKGVVLDQYLEKLLKDEGKSAAEYASKAPVKMDSRVPTLPAHYNFEGETSQGARRSDDKDPYYKPGQGALTTKVPRPLATPLTVPVADGVDGTDDGSRNGAGFNGHQNHNGAGHNGAKSDGAHGAKHV